MCRTTARSGEIVIPISPTCNQTACSGHRKPLKSSRRLNFKLRTCSGSGRYHAKISNLCVSFKADYVLLSFEMTVCSCGDLCTRPFLAQSAFLIPSLLSIPPRQHNKKRLPRCGVPNSDLSHTVPVTSRTHVHSPVIHRYADGSEESYAMWYTSHPPSKTSSIHLATSSDGISFTAIEGIHEGAVLSKNDEQWWAFDTKHVSLGDAMSGASSRVRADDDVVFLYYAGVTEQHDFRQRFRPKGGKIGVAISKDGEYFSRIEGEFPTGAVLEGDEGSFDEFGVCGPCVSMVGTKVVMHYHTYSKQAGYILGRAVSKDGIVFRKTGRITFADGEEFAGRGVLNPCVVENQRGYVMFVEVTSGQSSSIAFSESQNCERWGPLKLVLEGDPDSRNGIGTPYAVPMPDGSLKLYCTRYATGNSSLAVAESEGTDWTHFHTISSLGIQ